MMYFVIKNIQNKTIINCISEKELFKRLNENYWGENVKILNKIPDNFNINLWKGILIIKGDIIDIEKLNK